ncbi:MAG TPA: YggS family pyridoxal phosphate-dependent enzyme [Chloroflexia bacterium]|nr:YggS family pyridoxal phosphate-dependent enzyme [Chloroflexia bacterium]
MSDIMANLEIIRERIADAAERSGRSPDAITLIAVTKTVPAAHIIAAIQAGITHFGENRVQEAAAKYAPQRGTENDGPDLVPRASITLHMIGNLQRNKAHRAAAIFDWVQSVDRPELAETLNRACAEQRPNEPLPVLLEVNLTGEASKSGVTPEDLPKLADTVTACPNLRPSGLMAIARMGAQEPELRRTFAHLRNLLEGLHQTYPGDWTHLSMGMSDDYTHAIAEGATMIRLGRALFGDRPK